MAYRRVVAAYFFLQGLCAASFTAQIPALQQRLQLDHARLGTVLLALSAGGLCAMPLAGAGLARARGKAPLALGAAAHACMLAACSYAADAGGMMACLFAFGAANTAVQITVNQHALAVQGLVGRSVMAGYHGCWSVAAALAALAAYASARLGVAPEAHQRAVAVLALVAVASLVATRGAEPLPVRWTFRRARRTHARRAPLSRALVALGATTAGAMAVEATAFDWGAVLYRQTLAGDVTRAGLGYAMLMLGMTLGRLLADCAADRVRPENLLVALTVAVAAGGGLAAASLHPVAILVGLACMGLGLSALVPLLLSACDGPFGLAPAGALAWTSGVGAAGALAGPTLLGWSAQWVGLRPAFAFAAALALGVGAAGRTLLQQITPPAAHPPKRAATAQPWQLGAARRDFSAPLR